MHSEDGKGEPAEMTAEALAALLKLADGAGFLVRILNSRATSEYERLTGQAGITPQQFGALLTLNQRGALTLTELAAAVHLDRSTLGEMARRMAARGLIRRSGNAADRRSTKVALTPAGRRVLLDLVAGAAALQDALLAPVPPDERRSFLRNLKRVAFGASGEALRQEEPVTRQKPG